MPRPLLPLLTASVLIAADAPPPAAGVLWYRQPAKRWEPEALPIGNGRLGAMCFGGVAKERIQFNEESLWTGGANPSGGYAYGNGRNEDGDCFGCYRNFGDLTIAFAMESVGEPEVGSPSGHGDGDGNGIARSVDGDPKSKWCTENQGRPVVWQLTLPKAQALDRYAFTSANDVPARDPSTWTLEGSADGTAWTVLDRHEGEKPFPGRHETREYRIANPMACRFYRLTFQPSASHFQIGEIDFPGTNLGSGKAAAPDGYVRSLDLATGIHCTSFVIGGITHRRVRQPSLNQAGGSASAGASSKPNAL